MNYDCPCSDTSGKTGIPHIHYNRLWTEPVREDKMVALTTSDRVPTEWRERCNYRESNNG